MNLPVGIDDGFAQTKVVLPSGQTLAIPSHARSGPPRATGILDAKSAIGCYLTQDRTFSVGVADPESTRFAGYAHSALNRAIVHHALHMLKLQGQQIDVATGLPVSDYYQQSGEKRSSLIEQKQRSLLLPVEKDSGESVAVGFHTVVPEALAAWYDLVIDDRSGQPALDQELMSSPLAVIDIGGRTTDLVVIVDQMINHGLSGSTEIGVLDLQERLKERLCSEFQLSSISASTVHKALTSESVDLYGKRQDVSKLVQDCSQEVLANLADQCRRRLGQAAELHQVLFVGGGSALFRNDLGGWFRNGVFPAEPTFANARGLLKFLRYVCERPTHPTVITAEQ